MGPINGGRAQQDILYPHLQQIKATQTWCFQNLHPNKKVSPGSLIALQSQKEVLLTTSGEPNITSTEDQLGAREVLDPISTCK